MARTITFAGTGTTLANNVDMRILLYYWPISDLPSKPISGEVTVTLHGSQGDNYTTSDYSLVLFDGGNQEFPELVPDWYKKNEGNVAYASDLDGDMSGTASYFYLNNTNFTNNYSFYVNIPVTITMVQDGTAETKTFNFTIPEEYQNKDLWNGHNIFLGFATQASENKGIYWRKESIATLTLNTPSGIVRYYNGTEWKDCEVCYYDGSDWKQCEVNYYDGNSWQIIG